MRRRIRSRRTSKFSVESSAALTEGIEIALGHAAQHLAFERDA
jgi:hypothetical protein